MTKLWFEYFMDYEDGKMASVYTTEGPETEIPINIFIDNADEYKDAEEGPCEIEICAVGNNVQIFPSEEDYLKSDHKMAPISMIPMGTFPANGDFEHFEPSPHILYTGKVLAVEWNPSAEPGKANCDIAIETLGFTFNLYLCYDGKVEPGNIVHGVAWLYGDMFMDKCR